MENDNLEDLIKKATLEKLQSEKQKIDAERLEIEEKNKLVFSGPKFFQIVAGALIGIPLLYFYFLNVIEPALQKDRLEYEIANLTTEKELIERKIKIDSLAMEIEKKELDKKLTLTYLDELLYNSQNNILDYLNSRGEFRVGTIYLEYDKSNISPQYKAILQKIIEYLIGNPEAKVRISSQYSYPGNFAYNQQISSRIGKNVADYIIANGVNYENIIIQGYGAIKPDEIKNLSDTELQAFFTKLNSSVDIFIIP